MANLYFPQLTAGAMAQYPIRKVRLDRTIKNILPDGSMILSSDPSGARLVWQLSYTDLAISDVEAIQAHFNACIGPFHAFTFIDPTDNMLLASSDLTNTVWQASSLIQVVLGASDPTGGSGAFVVTNTGQANEEISQTLSVPGNYQYCFSLYANSAQPSTLALVRRGSSSEGSDNIPVGPGWTRIASGGRLEDTGDVFTVAISLLAGQQVELYGMQLEAQIAPSRYRPTGAANGIHSNAHWTTNQLTVTADGLNLFSTAFSIEAST